MATSAEKSVNLDKLNIDLCGLDREKLIEAQQKGSSLDNLRRVALNENLISTEAVCYYFQDGVLIRKQRPLDSAATGTWSEAHQILYLNHPIRN